MADNKAPTKDEKQKLEAKRRTVDPKEAGLANGEMQAKDAQDKPPQSQ